MEPSEETPLLPDYEARSHEIMNSHELIYERFSPHQKRVLLQILSSYALLPLFVATSVYPAIPEMVKDFHSTPEMIGYTVSLSIFSASVGALTAASCSTFYGRRPIYLFALPLLIFGSLGVYLSRTIEELFFFMMCQAFGASPGFSIGAGVIGDIYKMEERGTVMGIFLAALLMGGIIGPVAGGLAVEYASWRVMQLTIGVFGVVVFGIIWFSFPETSHPGIRGIDKLRHKAESGAIIRWTNYMVNPLAPLGLLRAVNVLIVTFVCVTVALSWYVMMVPLAYTVGVKYNITNVALLGACSIPSAVGEIIAAPLSGRLSDRIIIQSRQSRGGAWYPEDRLRAALGGTLIFTPLSLILSGIITEYIEGPIGLALYLGCLFLNGFGVQMVLGPAAAYVVDVLHLRSAEAAAIINGFRNTIISFAISGIIPMISAYGVMVTNIASGVVVWLGFGLLWLTIQYGDSMRASCNIEFSTNDSN